MERFPDLWERGGSFTLRGKQRTALEKMFGFSLGTLWSVTSCTNGMPWAVANWFNWQWKIWLARFEGDGQNLHPITLYVRWEKASPLQTFSVDMDMWIHLIGCGNVPSAESCLKSYLKAQTFISGTQLLICWILQQKKKRKITIHITLKRPVKVSPISWLN